MKLTPIFALLAVSAPVISHAQTAGAPAVAAIPMAPKSAETSDAFVWRFAPPVGSRWTMRSFVRETSRTQVPAIGGSKAESMQFKMIQKLTADYDVLSRDELGATTIRMTLRNEAHNTTSTFEGKTTQIITPKIPNSKSINGATFIIKQAPDGTVWNVVGTRAFMRHALEASASFNAATINKILNTTSAADEKEMIKSLNLITGTLPTSPVRVGESWNYNASLLRHLTIAPEISGTRTLKSLGSDVAVIVDKAHFSNGKSPQKLPDTPRRRNVRGRE